MVKRNNHINVKTFQSFKSGDEGAFNLLYKAYILDVIKFCENFLGDNDKSKSVTQDTFIYLWNNREKVNTIGGIKSFLYTKSKSLCLNILRHEKVVRKYKNQALNDREQQLNIEVLNSIEYTPVVIKELEEKLQFFINSLPEKTKQVFIKKRFENKKNRVIAAELQFSEKSVEAHMTKALKLLKFKISHLLFIVFFFSYQFF